MQTKICGNRQVALVDLLFKVINVCPKRDLSLSCKNVYRASITVINQNIN